MTKRHTKRNIKKSRSKQRVSRKRTKRKTRRVRRSKKGGSIAMASKAILPLGVLIAAYLLYNRNSNSNSNSKSNRDVNMDIEALSKNLGLTNFDQSFSQDAEAEFKEMQKLMGGGNNKDDFESLCNILKIARKWKSEGRSTNTIKDAVKKLTANITMLRNKGATKETVSSEITKCLVGYSGKGGKRKQHGGFMSINDMLLGAIAVALGAGYATRNKSLKRKKSLKRVTSVWGDL